MHNNLQTYKTAIMTKKRLSILLAEDNPLNQRLAQINIERMGHLLVMATDGFEAIKAYKEKEFDIILMDINMPGLNGLDASKIIRKIEEEQNNRRVRIIALTAYGNEETDSYLEAGMDAWFCKPYGRNDLQRMLS